MERFFRFSRREETGTYGMSYLPVPIFSTTWFIREDTRKDAKEKMVKRINGLNSSCLYDIEYAPV